MLLLCIPCFTAFAQQVTSTQKNLIWSDTLRKIEFSDFNMHATQYFKGAAYDEAQFDFLPYFFQTMALPNDGDLTIVLTDETYAALKDQPGRSISISDNKIQSTPIVKVGKGYQRGKSYANISILPFRKNNATGEIEKLISFKYQINITQTFSANTRGDSYSAQSVLATGNWYKIAVTNDGVYKITKSFLQDLGIDVGSLDPRNIRVYGNGGGMLPEANATFRYDDLHEDPIYVAGESDGRFDDGDYVLFYGMAADRWRLDATTKKFVHTRNLFTDSAFYFINTDLGAGKRIANRGADAGSPNYFVSTFDDHALHEVDLENFLFSGRAWYGEAFEFETTQSFPFSMPSLVTSTPVSVVVSFLAKSIYASNTVNVSNNGLQFTTASIDKICSDYTCPVGNEKSMSGSFTSTSPSFNIDIQFVRNADDAQGWLNYIEVNAQRNLTWSGLQTNFRSIGATVVDNVSQFTIDNANSSILVWDVTDPVNPQSQIATLNGSQLQFTTKTDTLREYVMFINSEGYTPTAIGKINNQNLHGLAAADLIIVTPSFLNSQAQDLANFHISNDGISSMVVNIDQLYNEFSSGNPDMTAIRDFVRMLYKRANGDTVTMPKYLLMFGDGSYDNKGIDVATKGVLPTYQSASSLSPTSSFVSDDYYAFLDDNEGGNILDINAKMDIAIGRLPVNDVAQATDVINKIKIYESPQSFGNWRNVITFVDDDQDNDVHVDDCDEIAQEVSTTYPVYNIDKIYLDAYQQISVPGGTRYPDVNVAINNRICSGTLLMNYVGHGGVGGWAHERVLSINEINSYTNLYKLPVFVTATCEFSKYDEPSITSAGESLLLNAGGGAIAMITTVRLVYSSANKLMNEAFMTNVFVPDANGIVPPIGEVLRQAKNSISGDVNNRKFTLLGDPAIRMANPEFNVNTTSINGHVINGAITDTLKALQKITIAGTVNDIEGNIMTDFNGTLYPTIYDKFQNYQTLKNDADSKVKNFLLQKNVIYNGKASVKNGAFTFSFIVPKDISYLYGKGKLSYYADNGTVDAHGYRNDVTIGGISDTSEVDLNGPQVKVFMNDEKFVQGGITNTDPNILVRLFDSSGVNTVGTGIGHDIAGTLDNDQKNILVMNEFYSSDLDSYTSGEVRYPLTNLAEGYH
ncbi:MAG: type IX secretion system sortase PorU, partial [Chitinophagales bacterium]|nr:type IX secretion system sortase PorU [Chitinophagales bacterium]